ncbi:LysR family transcriptional regulator [Noviherbaspirillum malthae]|uniref:LysR family transcriptional regulator n=1 Tax=Noviherbaspirillum malthae TaxID=1260987 RepID=UPI00188E45D8|nr:LysR family transcriptional regulator [Noviherbaspirillum malthae]
MGIDIRGMRIVVAVADAQSISRAAQRLHIAQPALSLHLRSIEEELGVQLFERSARGVIPTPAGMRFVGHAQDILKRVDNAYHDVRDAVAQPAGAVTVAMPQSIAKVLAVPVVSEVVRRWPKISLHMVELSTGYIPEYVAGGQVDLGITFAILEGAGMRFEHLCDEELVLITSPEQLHAAFGDQHTPRSSVMLRELSKLPMILPGSAHSLRKRLEATFALHNVALELVAEVDVIPQLIELAAAGIGSTILSCASAVGSPHGDKLAVLAIDEPKLHRSVYLCQSATAPQTIATTVVSELISQLARKLVAEEQWPTSGASSCYRS